MHQGICTVSRIQEDVESQKWRNINKTLLLQQKTTYNKRLARRYCKCTIHRGKYIRSGGASMDCKNNAIGV